MPLYEYRCDECAHVFEVFTQRRDGARSPACPGCGTPDAERIWSAFASRPVEGGCSPAAPGGG